MKFQGAGRKEKYQNYKYMRSRKKARGELYERNKLEKGF